MKCIKLILAMVILILNATLVHAEQSQDDHGTNVTSSMARKILYKFETDDNVQGFIYGIFPNNSMRDINEIMQNMLVDPNVAKPVIYKLFNVWGVKDSSRAVFMQGYGFTESEFETALNIYDEKYHFRQREAEEDRQRLQKENIQQQKLRQATTAESALYDRWMQSGPEYFDTFPKDNGVPPTLDINYGDIVKKIDSSGLSPSLSGMRESSIMLEILYDKTLGNIKTCGNLSGLDLANDFSVIEPPKYKFRHINKLYPISCNYLIDITETGDLLGNIKCKIKYNQKSNIWEIDILDYTGFMGTRESIPYYENLYKRTVYNTELSYSAKDAIASAIAKAINSDDSIRNKLFKGKHTIECSVYNHCIRFNRASFDLQPFVDNIVIQ